MVWSKVFIPTLREAPAGIPTAGGRYLARAGYQREEAWLFLGRRSLRRIANMVRAELDVLGAQEMLSPKQPIPHFARELRSYKQLPQLWWQFRDAVEAVSFDRSSEDREQRYQAMRAAIQNVLRNCRVECMIADSIWGEKFVIPCLSGEDAIVRAGSYVADLSSAVSTATPPSVPDPEGDFAPEAFHTPNRKTIADLSEFTGLPETSHIKSLVMVADRDLVMVLLRGDHQLSEAKLSRALAAKILRPAIPSEMQKALGAEPGSLGPIGVTGMRILADEALRGRRNMIAGANRDDYHLRHVTPEISFEAEFFDLRQANAGELHAATGEALKIEKAVILASLSCDPPDEQLHVTGENGAEVPVFLSSFSIAGTNLLWAAAEQHHDSDGLALPPPIAPFDIVITPVDFASEAQRNAAQAMIDAASAMGLEVLLDDRDERPGVKFKDADLIGVPWRIIIGKKLEQGMVEVFERRTKQKSDVPLSEAIGLIHTRR